MKDDFQLVKPGAYPGNTRPYQDSDLTLKTKNILDADQQLLNLIVQRVYPRAGDLFYSYMSTRIDGERQIMRYFGKVEDLVIAGYQIQFVFDGYEKLILVCVAQVPLE